MPSFSPADYLPEDAEGITLSPGLASLPSLDAAALATQGPGDLDAMLYPAPMAPAPVAKSSPAAEPEAFGAAFNAARDAGKKVFTWKGRSYTTQLAEEKKVAEPAPKVEKRRPTEPYAAPPALSPEVAPLIATPGLDAVLRLNPGAVQREVLGAAGIRTPDVVAPGKEAAYAAQAAPATARRAAAAEDAYRRSQRLAEVQRHYPGISDVQARKLIDRELAGGDPAIGGPEVSDLDHRIAEGVSAGRSQSLSEGLTNSLTSGFKQVGTGLAVAGAVPNSDALASALSNALSHPSPEGKAANAFSAQLGRALLDTGKSFDGVRKAWRVMGEIADNPLGFAQFGINQAPLVGTLVLSALGGAAAGSSLGPGGSYAGAATSMGATEYALELGSQLQDRVGRALNGKPPTKENVAAVLADNPDLVKRASIKAAGTAAIDAITTMAGVRITANAVRDSVARARATLGPASPKELFSFVARDLAKSPGHAAAGYAVDVVGAPISEAAPQKWAYGSVNDQDVAEETLGELVFSALGLPAVASNVARTATGPDARASVLINALNQDFAPLYPNTVTPATRPSILPHQGASAQSTTEDEGLAAALAPLTQAQTATPSTAPEVARADASTSAPSVSATGTQLPSELSGSVSAGPVPEAAVRPAGIDLGLSAMSPSAPSPITLDTSAPMGPTRHGLSGIPSYDDIELAPSVPGPRSGALGTAAPAGPRGMSGVPGAIDMPLPTGPVPGREAEIALDVAPAAPATAPDVAPAVAEPSGLPPELERARQLLYAADAGDASINPGVITEVARGIGLDVPAFARTGDTLARIREVLSEAAPAAAIAPPGHAGVAATEPAGGAAAGSDAVPQLLSALDAAQAAGDAAGVLNVAGQMGVDVPQSARVDEVAAQLRASLESALSGQPAPQAAVTGERTEAPAGVPPEIARAQGLLAQARTGAPVDPGAVVRTAQELGIPVTGESTAAQVLPMLQQRVDAAVAQAPTAAPNGAAAASTATAAVTAQPEAASGTLSSAATVVPEPAAVTGARDSTFADTLASAGEALPVLLEGAPARAVAQAITTRPTLAEPIQAAMPADAWAEVAALLPAEAIPAAGAAAAGPVATEPAATPTTETEQPEAGVAPMATAEPSQPEPAAATGAVAQEPATASAVAQEQQNGSLYATEEEAQSRGNAMSVPIEVAPTTVVPAAAAQAQNTAYGDTAPAGPAADPVVSRPTTPYAGDGMSMGPVVKWQPDPKKVTNLAALERILQGVMTHTPAEEALHSELSSLVARGARLKPLETTPLVAEARGLIRAYNEASNPAGDPRVQQQDIAALQTVQRAAQSTYPGAQLQLADPASLPSRATGRPGVGQVTREDAEIVRTIAGAVTGRRVVFYTANKDVGDGIFFGKKPKHLFLNTRQSVEPLVTLGHEFGHSLRQQHEDLYQAVRAVAVADLADGDRSLASQFNTHTGQNASESEALAALDTPVPGENRTYRDFLEEELVSDLFGNRMVEPAHWQRVFSQLPDKSVVRRLAEVVMKAVDKVRVALGGRPSYATDALIKDLDRVRDAVATAHAEYLRRGGSPAVAEAAAMRESPRRAQARRVDEKVTQGAVKLVPRLMKLARQGVAGRDWYEDSAREILRVFGGNLEQAEKFIRVIAITSASTEVQANTTLAVKAWKQYAAGAPIQGSGFKAKDRALTDTLYFGDAWDGIKTNTFYINLTEAMRGHDSGFSTQDMHMGNAGYGHPKLTTFQYQTLEEATRIAAKQLGMLPRQFQAAVWVPQKVKHLLAEWDRRGLHQGLSPSERQAKAFDRSIRSYADYLRAKGITSLPVSEITKITDEARRRATQTAYVEAVPSTKTRVGAAVAALPAKEQDAFTREVFNRVQPSEVARAVIARDDVEVRAEASSGGYEPEGYSRGVISPNRVVQLVSRTGTPVSLDEARAVAQALNYVYTQDGVPVARYDPAMLDAPDAVHVARFTLPVNASGKVTSAALKKFYNVLQKHFGHDIGFSRDREAGVLVGNYAGADNLEFGRQAQAAAQDAGVPLEWTASEGDYIYHDWQTDPAGRRHAARDTAGAGRRSALQKRLEHWRGAAVQASEDWLTERGIKFSPGRAGPGEVAGPDAGGSQSGDPERRGAAGRDADRGHADAGRDDSQRARFAENARPRFGAVDAKPTAVSAVAVHYSDGERSVLSTDAYGRGLSGRGGGAEFEGTMADADRRLHSRTMFYVQSPRGVHPELGVGTHAHTVELHNLYDALNDPLDLWLRAAKRAQSTGTPGTLRFEALVLDEGFDGYLAEHAAVVLGRGKHIPVRYEGTVVPSDLPTPTRAKPSAFLTTQRAVINNRSLPAGVMKGESWKRVMARLMPDVDVSHLEDGREYYRNQIVAAPPLRASRTRFFL